LSVNMYTLKWRKIN